MPFTLFTIIQADDDALSPAADYLEHLFYTSHPRHSDLMARSSDRRPSATVTAASELPSDPIDTIVEDKETSELPAATAPTPTSELPIRTPRPINATREREARPLSWCAGSPALRPSHAAGQQTRTRAPQPVRSYVPSRSLTTSPVPSSTPTFAVPSSQARARSHPRSSPRTRSPLRSVLDDSPAISYDSGFEIIAEDSELDLSQHHGATDRTMLPSQVYAKPTRTITPRRQRPASPLHGANTSGQLLSSASSPALSSMRYNESFPSLHYFGSTSSLSSVPSTPSSMRSRSPSISSLDTIEDNPDLESEAIEAEKTSMSVQTHEGHAARSRTGSLEVAKTSPVGFGFGRAAQRKRWSVCGAERRADLDLETIWEDRDTSQPPPHH